jgi:NADPH:quinone reductase-like Zn-dependent oxidoreductase
MITMYFHMQGTRAELAELVRLVAEGSLQPVIDSSYSLRDAAAAQQKLAEQKQFGRVVLTLSSGL